MIWPSTRSAELRRALRQGRTLREGRHLAGPNVRLTASSPASLRALSLAGSCSSSVSSTLSSARVTQSASSSGSGPTSWLLVRRREVSAAHLPVEAGGGRRGQKGE